MGAIVGKEVVGEAVVEKARSSWAISGARPNTRITGMSWTALSGVRRLWAKRPWARPWVGDEDGDAVGEEDGALETFALVCEEVVNEPVCKEEGDALDGDALDGDAVGEEDGAEVNSQFSVPRKMFRTTALFVAEKEQTNKYIN